LQQKHWPLELHFIHPYGINHPFSYFVIHQSSWTQDLWNQHTISRSMIVGYVVFLVNILIIMQPYRLFNSNLFSTIHQKNRLFNLLGSPKLSFNFKKYAIENVVESELVKKRGFLLTCRRHVLALWTFFTNQ
jgi:hypothetical protein